MIRFLLLLGAAISFGGCDCLQTVNGIVKDQNTDQVIEGAVAFKENDNATRDTTTTDGTFLLSDVTGKHDCPFMKVTVEKDGYTSTTVSIPNDGEAVIYLSN